MKRKKIILWFSTYMLITISLITAITWFNRADDGRQKAQAGVSAGADERKENLKNDPMPEEDTTEPEPSVNPQESSGTGEQKPQEPQEMEAQTVDVEAVTAIASDGVTIRSNQGARVFADIDPDKPMVALTFDDGPNQESTNIILDALEKYHARATFFVVGYKVTDNADTIARAYDLGCEIGSHTYDHIDLTTLNRQQIRKQIRETEKVIRSVTGQSRVLIRPPYGSVNEDVLGEITTPIILWSIDTEDWKTRDTEQTIQWVMDNVKDGDIILIHDSYEESADAGKQIIKKLVKQGYQLVTVSELGYYKLGGLATGVKYGYIDGN